VRRGGASHFLEQEPVCEGESLRDLNVPTIHHRPPGEVEPPSEAPRLLLHDHFRPASPAGNRLVIPRVPDETNATAAGIEPRQLLQGTEFLPEQRGSTLTRPRVHPGAGGPQPQEDAQGGTGDLALHVHPEAFSVSPEPVEGGMAALLKLGQIGRVVSNAVIRNGQVSLETRGHVQAPSRREEPRCVEEERQVASSLRGQEDGGLQCEAVGATGPALRRPDVFPSRSRPLRSPRNRGLRRSRSSRTGIPRVPTQMRGPRRKDRSDAAHPAERRPSPTRT
jgi:hypothetical protein